MIESDISKYTLQELHEAFESINDQKYPERAIQLYLRIQELEEDEKVKNKKHSAIDTMKSLGDIYHFIRHPIGAFLIEQIRQDDLEEKIRRVKQLLKEKKNNT